METGSQGLTMKRALFLAATVIAVAAAPAQAVTGNAKAGLKAMRELNFISLGNLSVQGGEIEGKAFVGGDISGNSFQVGFGSSANPTQGLKQSARSTLTVGGAVNGNINLLNGSNGGNGLIGAFGITNVYGATIAGNLQSINLNSTGGTVRVGGSIQNNLNIGAGTSMFVTGSMLNGANLSDNVKLSVGGNLGQVQGGQNTTVKVTGNVANLGVGAGGNARIGGSLAQLSGSSNQSVAVVGNIAQGNAGNNSVITSGGSININGSGGTAVYAGGNISGNTNGATFSPNFVWNGSISAPVAPIAPAAPDVASQTTQLRADLVALSSTLSALTIANNLSTITWTGGTQRATFNAVDTGAGFALFNVTASIFAAQEFAYNFSNTTLPVIINVSGANSYFMQSNFINNANLNNQQVIWNFGTATSVTFDRAMHGSILAPLAAVQARIVEGTVAAARYTMQDEVHLGAYAGNADFLPEPGTWVQMIAGFGLVGAFARRRRQRVIA